MFLCFSGNDAYCGSVELYDAQLCLCIGKQGTYTYKGFNPFCTVYPQMGSLANGDDPDEMQQNASFHQGHLVC